jgi:hypothetical protein
LQSSGGRAHDQVVSLIVATNGHYYLAGHSKPVIARRALVADSANTYVKEHLADTMRRRVELLQRATMLASTSGQEETR